MGSRNFGAADLPELRRGRRPFFDTRLKGGSEGLDGNGPRPAERIDEYRNQPPLAQRIDTRGSGMSSGLERGSDTANSGREGGLNHSGHPRGCRPAPRREIEGHE